MCQLLKVAVMNSQVTVIKTGMNTRAVTQLYLWNCDLPSSDSPLNYVWSSVLSDIPLCRR